VNYLIAAIIFLKYSPITLRILGSTIFKALEACKWMDSDEKQIGVRRG
jgi:hypothetical protein